MENLKSAGRPALYLQLLNAASFGVVAYTVISSVLYLKGLPEQLHITNMAGLGHGEVVSKSIFRDDLYLMVAIYLLISLIGIYLRVIPFRNNKGQAMAVIASFMNLCICLIFSLVIVGTLKQVI